MTIAEYITQSWWVIWSTYSIIELIKPLVPDEYKKFIPVFSMAISWGISLAIGMWDPLQDFLNGVFLWLTASKAYDIKKDISKDALTPYQKDDEYNTDLSDK